MSKSGSCRFFRHFFAQLFFSICLSHFSHGQYLEWINVWGGSSNDTPAAITTDQNGSVYVCGSFASYNVDFDPGVGQELLSGDFYGDVFICKYFSDGTLAWAKEVGGLGVDKARCIKVDFDGNVYVGGHYNGQTDFDPGPDEYELTGPHYESSHRLAYILKLNSEGEFNWVKVLTGSGSISCNGIEIGVNGDLYVVGTSSTSINGNTDYDPGPGEFLVSSYLGDLFVLKLTPEGNFNWVRTVANNANNWGTAIAIDSIDNVFASGRSLNQAVAVKLDSTGNELWLAQFGGVNSVAEDVTLAPDGSVTIVGSYESYADFDPGPGIVGLLPSSANEEVFVLSLDNDGNFNWAKSVGGYEDDLASSIVTDEDGFHYILGVIRDTADVDPGVNSHLMSAYGRDVFLLKLNSLGEYVWAKQFVGSAPIYNSEEPDGLALDNLGNVFLTGFFRDSVDFDAGPQVNRITSIGGQDGYLMKFSPCSITTSELSLDGCEKTTSPSGNFTWTESGVYMDLIHNSVGCDSVITINLTVEENNIDVGILNNGASLTSNESSASYAWLDCDDNYSSISAATNQSFSPSVSGEFAVEITVGACVDTSNCQPITIVGFEDLKNDELVVYPNPAKDDLVIDCQHEIISTELFNQFGKLVYSEFNCTSQNRRIDLSRLKAGVYMLVVETERGTSRLKLTVL